MFIHALKRQNPALITAAIRLWQQGRIVPDSWVIDVDQVLENGKRLVDTAHQYGITLYLMTKQLGRNPWLAEKLLALCGLSPADIGTPAARELEQQAKRLGHGKLAAELGVGVPTLEDMIEELLRPGRDMRDSLPKPLLRTDVLDMKDLTPGMQLTGTVRNVIDFGAFVDIGVHQDGLVHISQISSRFIRHPSEVLKVGDVVTVWVLSVDLQKKRIALTMKQPKTEQAH